MKDAVQLQFEERKYIHLSLLHLGVIKWSKSARRLRSAIEYVLEHEAIIELPIGYLYEYLAKQEGCSYNVIERSLRYVINDLWRCDPKNCSKLFLRSAKPLPCPCVSEFLCLYIAAFQRGVIREWVDSFERRNVLFEYREMEESQLLINKISKVSIPQ